MKSREFINFRVAIGLWQWALLDEVRFQSGKSDNK
jgi:hypothetical protein